MPLFQDHQHRNIAFWGMAMIAVGLPLSIFLTSVGVIVLLVNWFLEGQVIKKGKKFFSDPLSLAVSSVFIMYCFAMLWTGDLISGLKDIKTKLPLLIIPLVLFTGKLHSKEQLRQVLMLFVVACMVGILFGLARYISLSEADLTNKRQLSVFISHIRFGLMLVLAFFILLYYLYAKWSHWSATEKILSILSLFCMLWFILILEAFTAYIAFAAVVSVATLLLFKQRVSGKLKVYGTLSVILLIAITSFSTMQVYKDYKHEVPFNYLTQNSRTLNGNLYSHLKDVKFRENGHRVWNYVCWEELEAEWPKRSSVNLTEHDKKGQEIKFTAVRYMTSKGLKKDSAGVSQLTDQDILNIEAGYTNHLHTGKLGFARRLDQMLWAIEQYSWYQNANNSSTLQRWVYFDIGLDIWKDNLIFGVGTGDLKQSYQDAFADDNRGLEEQFQGISHNQYLTVGIMLGLAGFIIFCISIFYPLFLYRSDFLYVVFITLMLVSFMTDNTFNRQAGVILFAFFNSLLIVRKEFADS